MTQLRSYCLGELNHSCWSLKEGYGFFSLVGIFLFIYSANVKGKKSIKHTELLSAKWMTAASKHTEIPAQMPIQLLFHPATKLFQTQKLP